MNLQMPPLSSSLQGISKRWRFTILRLCLLLPRGKANKIKSASHYLIPDSLQIEPFVHGHEYISNIQTVRLASTNHQAPPPTFLHPKHTISTSTPIMRFTLPTYFPLFQRDPLSEENFHRKPLPTPAIDLRSAEGKKRFRSALSQGNAEAFFPLMAQYQTQAHPAYCGITSLCMILNTLEIDPQKVWLLPWRWFMEPMLHCCFDLEKVKTCGVTVDEVARAGRLHGASVEVHRLVSVEKSRELIMNSVRGDKNDSSSGYVIASYDRDALGQTGTGHFSPLAAYDAATDSVLIFDVARFKYGPHWVPLKDLVYATSLPDPDVGIPRGFLLLRKETEETANESHNSPRYQRDRFRTSSLLCSVKGMPLFLAGVIALGFLAVASHVYT